MAHVRELKSGDLGNLQKYTEGNQGKINEIERAMAAKKEVLLSEPTSVDKKPHYIKVTVDGKEILSIRKF